MTDGLLRIGPALGVALVLLAVLACAVAWAGGTGHARGIAFASVRATLQLAALGAALTFIVTSLWFTAAFVLLMATTASWTAAGRVLSRRPTLREAAITGLPIVSASVGVVVSLVSAGVVPTRGIAIIPIIGILLGGAMTTASLAGRRALTELTARRGEVEAGLTLGLDPAFIRMDVCRQSAATALIPGLDQTRTVGLVTIPGAFVGMVLGGASPLAAGVMQLFVLIALLAVSAVALVATTLSVAHGLLGDRAP